MAAVTLVGAFPGCAAPVASATISCVAVATPLMRCMKLSATRSATRMERALPRTEPNCVPQATESPSLAVHVTCAHGCVHGLRMDCCGRWQGRRLRQGPGQEACCGQVCVLKLVRDSACMDTTI